MRLFVCVLEVTRAYGVSRGDDSQDLFLFLGFHA